MGGGEKMGASVMDGQCIDGLGSDGVWCDTEDGRFEEEQAEWVGDSEPSDGADFVISEGDVWGDREFEMSESLFRFGGEWGWWIEEQFGLNAWMGESELVDFVEQGPFSDANAGGGSNLKHGRCVGLNFDGGRFASHGESEGGCREDQEQSAGGVAKKHPERADRRRAKRLVLKEELFAIDHGPDEIFVGFGELVATRL